MIRRALHRLTTWWRDFLNGCNCAECSAFRNDETENRS